MTNIGLFRGVHAVLYAMFSPDEKLDHTAMAHQVEYCISNGCHGIVVLGLATEVLKLTLEERKALVSTVGQTNKGRLPFSVTISGNSVAEQLDLANHSIKNGADGLILQPPMAGSYDAEVYLSFFKRVAQALPTSVAIQNAPEYLGRALSGDDIAKLRESCPNLIAVKSEDTIENLAGIIAATGPDVAIIGGRGGLEFIDNLRIGCQGFVLAPDIAPLAAKIHDLWCSGNTRKAQHLFQDAQPSIEFVMQSLEHLVIYGKRIFASHAGQEIHDRAPYMAPKGDEIATASRCADQLSILLRSAAE